MPGCVIIWPSAGCVPVASLVSSGAAVVSAGASVRGCGGGVRRCVGRGCGGGVRRCVGLLGCGRGIGGLVVIVVVATGGEHDRRGREQSHQLAGASYFHPPCRGHRAPDVDAITRAGRRTPPGPNVQVAPCGCKDRPTRRHEKLLTTFLFAWNERREHSHLVIGHVGGDVRRSHGANTQHARRGAAVEHSAPLARPSGGRRAPGEVP